MEFIKNLFKKEIPANDPEIRKARLERSFFETEPNNVVETDSKEEIKDILNKGKQGVIYGFLYKGVSLRIGYKPGIGTMMYQIKYGNAEKRCEHGCEFNEALDKADELIAKSQDSK